MKAAFMDRPGHLYLEEVSAPTCGPQQVLVQVLKAGLCGSDMHYYTHGRLGDNVVRQPHVLGHECSGLVAEVGAEVSGLRVGDRVAVEPGVPCLSCALCRAGRYNLCTEVRFLGVPHIPGAFREFLAHDPRFVYRLPEAVSFTQGALVEPLSVAHNAVVRMDLKPGDTILIIGAGAIGFSCLEIARAGGATSIIVCEPQEHRRRMALSLGATLALDSDSAELMEAVGELTGGRMCDCAIEASGMEGGIAAAIGGVRRGGRVALIGLGLNEARIPYAEVLKKEAALYGVYRYANDYQAVLALLGAGRIAGEPWVSHQYPLGRIAEAFEAANDPAVAKLKIMIDMAELGR